MKQSITFEQVRNWLDERAVLLSKGDPLTSDPRYFCALKLGVLESTFAHLLNNPNQRRELIKEITK
jgi:hypothetical protein